MAARAFAEKATAPRTHERARVPMVGSAGFYVPLAVTASGAPYGELAIAKGNVMSDKIFASPRLSTVDRCPKCSHMVSMTTDGPNGEQRRCLKCRDWSDIQVRDGGLPRSVERAVNILLNENLVNVGFQVENIVSSGIPVRQCRLDFEMANRWRGGAASVRWFSVNEHRDYQYLNNIRRGRIVNAGFAPGFVSACARELTKRDMLPGSLAITEASVDPAYAGRKFVRMQQNYFAGDKPSRRSLVVRVELSWHHDPADGIQPLEPWDRSDR